jgi:hypothetical protein
MGTWGEKPFENDAALDWLAELEEGGAGGLRELLTAEEEKAAARALRAFAAARHLAPLVELHLDWTASNEERDGTDDVS